MSKINHNTRFSKKKIHYLLIDWLEVDSFLNFELGQTQLYLSRVEFNLRQIKHFFSKFLLQVFQTIFGIWQDNLQTNILILFIYMKKQSLQLIPLKSDKQSDKFKQV